MQRRIVSGIVLTILLIGVLMLAFNIQPINAEPKTWYVDDSGGADFTKIEDAVYAASPGDTIYVHNGIYHEHVVIPINDLTLIGENKSDTIIDGDTMGSPIITMTDRINVKFMGFTVRNAGWIEWYGAGLRFANTKSCIISDNIFLNNRYGITPLSWGGSVGNIISDNTIKDGEFGIINFWDEPSYNNIIARNCISNISGGIYFNYPHNIQIVGNTISNMTGEVTYGIHFQMGGSNNTVVRNTVIGYCDYAIAIRHTDGNYVAENSLIGNFYGIDLGDSSCDNTVTQNNVSSNGVGISIFDNSNNNLINMNDISDSVPIDFYISDIGIWVESSHDNVIHNNNIANNGCGIYATYSSNNKVYHNNFLNNAIQASSYSSTNVWDNSYPSGGNYWSEYADVDLYSGQYQNETYSDGIWDHPYIIDESNQDSYPFTPSQDIAIVSVTPSLTKAYAGRIVNITVTVQNEGNFTKSFEITCKYTLEGFEHTIGTQIVSNLPPNTNTTLTFAWTATDVTVHTIKAEATILPGETDTTDNILTSPLTVKVTILGDVNADGVINLSDLVEAAIAFGSIPGSWAWDPQADTLQDDRINISDLVKIAQRFGQHI